MNDLIVMGFIVSYGISWMIIDKEIGDSVRGWLDDRAVPENSIRAVLALLCVLGPLTLVLAILRMLGRWGFHLGVAVRCLWPRKRPKLPTAVVHDQ
jgi:hypothetical protein